MKRTTIESVIIWGLFATLGVAGLGTMAVRSKGGPKPTWGNVLSKEFQERYEDWITQRLPTRHLIRSDAVLNFLLFRDVSIHMTIPVILGAHDTLFQKNYLDQYYNVETLKGDIPRIGSEPLETQVAHLKRVWQRLRARRKNFLLIVYPHKVWIYPEIIPRRWQLDPSLHDAAAREQDAFFAALDRSGVPWVNGVALFKQLRKNRPQLLLYNRGGTHWTTYTACLVWQEAFRDPKRYPASSLAPSLLCETHGTEPATGADLDIASLAGIDHVLGMTPFTDPVPVLEAGQRAPGVAVSFTQIGTSFSEALQVVGQEAHFMNSESIRIQYFHDNSVPMARILDSDWIVLEQQQGPKFYSNLENFLSQADDFLSQKTLKPTK